MRIRLAIMNFLEFAVWGTYLTCMGNYLGVAGLGDKISWFYAVQGLSSLFMPTLMGIVADKYIQPQWLLGFCHVLAGAFMLGCGWLGVHAGFGNEISDKPLFFALFALSVAFYMPTIALGNTTAFTLLKKNGFDTVKNFPVIRMVGTIGFIVAMWFVNCAVWQDGSFSMTLADNNHKFQYTYMQFVASGLLSIVLFLYCLTLPQCVLDKQVGERSMSERFGLNAFKLLKKRKMALLFVFSSLLGMCLQVTNGFAGPFITSFKGSADAAVAASFAANNATLLTSISQASEALCILMIPFSLNRYGIKVVMLMAMSAWVLRFGFFAIGNPAMPGVLFFIMSCIVYGVAFDFFNVAGCIYVYKECEQDIKASAQGLFMMMTSGIGATVGTLTAGEVVNANCRWENGYLVGDWQTCWVIFAAFALVIAVSFSLIFKNEK